MRIYNTSTPRITSHTVKINWSRELTFSERQINYILDYVPNARGIYCIYAKDTTFAYSSPSFVTNRWSPIIYIGSGWLDERICRHLKRKENTILAEYLSRYELGYRYERIYDDDLQQDWSRTVEAALLYHFKEKFGELPPANRRNEMIPPMNVDRFIIQESSNFSVLKRG